MSDPKEPADKRESGESYQHAIETGDYPFPGFVEFVDLPDSMGDEAHENMGPEPAATPASAFQNVGYISPRLSADYKPGMVLKTMRAKFYRGHREGSRPELIVIHTAESHEIPDAAENTGTWFQNTPKALSSHYGIDADGVVQYANESDTTWHTGGALVNGGKGPPWTNDQSIGLELAGTAKQTPDQWADDFSMRTLANAAALAAELCVRYNIPIKYVDAAGLKRGERGLTGHVDANEAAGLKGHWDPGPNFPWPEFIAMVQHFADTQGPLSGLGPARNPFPAVMSVTPATPVGPKRSTSEILAQRIAEIKEANALVAANAPTGSVAKLVGVGAVIAGSLYLGSKVYDMFKASRAKAARERDDDRQLARDREDRASREEREDRNARLANNRGVDGLFSGGSHESRGHESSGGMDFVPWYASGRTRSGA